MKLFQSDLLLIQSKTLKEYEVEYSNNAESEYVKIYDDDVIESIITDLLDKIDELEREVKHKQEEIEDIEKEIEDNYEPIPVSKQVGISDSDFM